MQKQGHLVYWSGGALPEQATSREQATYPQLPIACSGGSPKGKPPLTLPGICADCLSETDAASMGSCALEEDVMVNITQAYMRSCSPASQLKHASRVSEHESRMISVSLARLAGHTGDV